MTLIGTNNDRWAALRIAVSVMADPRVFVIYSQCHRSMPRLGRVRPALFSRQAKVTLRAIAIVSTRTDTLSLMPAAKTIEPKGLWWRVGETCLWLRNHWILAAIVFLAALALAILPRYALNGERVMMSWALFAVTILGVAAALSAIADKIADSHAKDIDAIAILGQQDAGSSAMAPIIALLDEVIDGGFATGNARRDRWVTLRSALAGAASQGPIAENVRASYYPVEYDAAGWRILDNPKSRGRVDEASTVFNEASDKDHPIWGILDGRDTECSIISAPDTNCRVPWTEKPYATFISVPVKAQGLLFGMLSMNAPKVGDLTELDRLSAIALARVMAAVLVLEAPPADMRKHRESLNSSDESEYAQAESGTEGT
jgi:hypothetical protein